MPSRGSKKQFCVHGHDTFVCGRNPSNNRCKECTKLDRIKNRERMRLWHKQNYKKNRIRILKENKIYNETHKEERAAYFKKYKKKNKKRIARTIRNRQLIKTYGITLEQFNKMLEDQKNKCAGCTGLIDKSKIRKRGLGVDHDHSTGKIRGLLCDNCNLIIGFAHDNIEILKKLMKYLQKHCKKNNKKSN